MQTFGITESYIYRLYRNWYGFCQRTRDSIKNAASKAIDCAEREARDDSYYNRYSQSSIDSWLSNEKDVIRDWERNMMHQLEEVENRGSSLIHSLQLKRFSETESYVRYIVDFNNYDLVSEKSYTEDISVSICGFSLSSGCRGFNFEEEFIPEQVEFTDWI